jgi:hypothetical protein
LYGVQAVESLSNTCCANKSQQTQNIIRNKNTDTISLLK